MGFLDRLFGGSRQQPAFGQQAPHHGQPQYNQPQYGQTPPAAGAAGPQTEDERAIAKYRYLLRTAPPEQVEEAHAQAFAQLTPQQRQQVLAEMSQSLPAGEAPRTDDPRDLARAATRAEMMHPGYMQRTFARPGMGMGMGGTVMGSMMGTIAGVVVGSAIADAMFDNDGFMGSPEAMGADGAMGSDLDFSAGSESLDFSAGSDSLDFGGGGGFDLGGDF